MKKKNFKTIQKLIFYLKKFWIKNNCSIIEPLDMEIGAGTYHPMTFFKTLGSKIFSLAYIQPSRRPNDGRYGKSTNRLQQYYQFQVIIKPSPKNIQKLFIKSLIYVGINIKKNDIRFVEDNWENPTLGAWGLGWEIWINGMEVAQFTYFQQMGGIECFPITIEITYGIERLSMYLQNVYNVYNLIWDINKKENIIYYKDIFYQNEIEQSKYNFKYSNLKFLFYSFNKFSNEINKFLLFKKPLILPAYFSLIKSTHIFNLIDARNAFSITERQRFILKIYNLTKKIAKTYLNFKKQIKF